MGNCCQAREIGPPPNLSFTVIARVVNYAGKEDYTIEVNGFTTISEMKELLQEKRNIGYKGDFEVRLMGEVLFDDNTVGYYGIKELDVVTFQVIHKE